MPKPIFKNLTPHPITISAVIDDRPVMLALPPEPSICRVQTESHALGTIGGIVHVQRQTFGAITGLPDPVPHTFYIVSGIVLNALKERGVTRPDVFAPATGPRDNAMRDSNGQVIAVTRLNALDMGAVA